MKEHRAYLIGRLAAAGIFVDPMEIWAAASDEPRELSPVRVHATLSGARAGDLRWELSTDVVVPTPTARQVVGERRFYAFRGESLAYVTELALPGTDFAPHLNATLHRA